MKPLDDFLEITAEISELDVDEIDVDAAIFDTGLTLDQFYVAFVRTAERNGRKLADVSPPEIRETELFSHSALPGLRDLAAFSAKARARLTPKVGTKEDTIRSLAASIEAGQYIPSTLDAVPIPPHGPGFVLAKYGMIFATAIAIPTYFSKRACTPLCSGSFNHRFEDSQPYYTISFGVLIFVLMVMLGPALRDIWWRKRGSPD